MKKILEGWAETNKGVIRKVAIYESQDHGDTLYHLKEEGKWNDSYSSGQLRGYLKQAIYLTMKRDVAKDGVTVTLKDKISLKGILP